MVRRVGMEGSRELLCVTWLMEKFAFCELTVAFSPLGLRKLEAFFGFLITIMALTFGYEASVAGYSLLFKTKKIFFAFSFKTI